MIGKVLGWRPASRKQASGTDPTIAESGDYVARKVGIRECHDHSSLLKLVPMFVELLGWLRYRGLEEGI